MRFKLNSLKATRLYFIGLLFAVSLRDVSHPLFDVIPTLDFFGVEIWRTAQLYSLQVLAMLSLGWAAYRPASALASLFAFLGFTIFTAASYSMVYANGFGYLPHSENIHFFLIALLALRNISEDRIWLTRSMIIVIGWSYFAAFLTKIRNVGFDWAWSETLPFYLKTFSLVSENETLAWFSTQHSLVSIAGTAALCFEFFALPALLWKPTRRFAIVLALVFHTVVYAVFDIQFLVSYIAAYTLIWNEDV